ncbi:hypothetical protein HK101_008576 [Irineochytrium annulatum]|nr:hypothetical protein HK101_008576 [Irineochytrium annulatum]
MDGGQDGGLKDGLWDGLDRCKGGGYEDDGFEDGRFDWILDPMRRRLDRDPSNSFGADGKAAEGTGEDDDSDGGCGGAAGAGVEEVVAGYAAMVAVPRPDERAFGRRVPRRRHLFSAVDMVAIKAWGDGADGGRLSRTGKRASKGECYGNSTWGGSVLGNRGACNAGSQAPAS